MKSAPEVDDLESVNSEIQTLTQRVDTIAEQSGGSNQIRSAATGDGNDDDDKLSQLGKMLS